MPYNMDNIDLKGEVLHIVNPEKAINYKWEKDSDKLSSGLQIISIDEIANLPEDVRKSHFGNKLISENDVLIFEPYSQRYVPVTEAQQSYLDRKYEALSLIAGLLGASKISMKVKTIEMEKRVLTADGEITYKAVDISLGIEKEQFEKYTCQYNKCSEYPNPGLTTVGYLKAERICKETSLIYDPEFKSLLDQRNPEHPNPIKKAVCNIELSRELNRHLDIAFNLNVLRGVFSLNASTKESISSSKKVIIETILEF